MFAPVGFFSKSSGIERYFALAATSFAFAFSETPNEATVTAWLMLPEPKILPGTTTVSASFGVPVYSAQVNGDALASCFR